MITFTIEYTRLSPAQDTARPTHITKVSSNKVGAAVTPAAVFIDMRTLPKAKHEQFGKATEVEQIEEGAMVIPPGAIEEERQKNPKHVQRTVGTQKRLGGISAAGVTPSQFLNPNPTFEGIGYTVLVPPDPNGAPGLNHYIQMVHPQFETFDKPAHSPARPINTNEF